MKKGYIAATILTSAFFISACGSPEEKVHKNLEETVVIEKDFEKQQKPMMELEKKEKALFDEIMELGMKKFDEISALSDEALANLDQREELLTKEEEAMDASKKEFEKTTGSIDKLKDDQLKEKASSLQKLMKQRYESHGELVKAYKEVIDTDRKIYEMMKDKELKIEDLEEQIIASNQAQENVMKANDTFNDLTEKFNKEKETFYKEAEIIQE